ncbi:MAG TPA: tetratricopeptide repeat protein [Myxococcota bacterium]|nr:tetratricopeptide repeat protein [Myxococcota bacterium]
MSLINDLLVAVDRRRDEANATPDERLADLVPRRTPAGPRRGAAPPFATVLLGSGIALLVGVMVGHAQELSARLRSMFDAGEARPVVSASGPDARPAVAMAPRPDPTPTGDVGLPTKTVTRAHARRTDDRRAATPPGRIETLDVISVRRPRVDGMTLERVGAGVQLRVLVDHRPLVRIERSAVDRDVEIVLEGVSVGAPIEPFDLTDTAIRRVMTRANGHDLRLSLALDGPMQVRSRWEESPDSSAIVVDLWPAPEDSETFSDIESIDRRIRATPLPAAADTSEAADPGPPRVVQISPSPHDRDRRDDEAARLRAAEKLRAARMARAEGDLAGAERAYAEALATLPGYRDAVLEAADLLAARGERDEALSLVREARRSADTDPGLLMMHARLLAEANAFSEAIELIDRSGLSPDDAPEVHALAAAYLQKIGDHARAIERYESILVRHPARARWWAGLGISLEAAGREVEALDVYRIAREVGELPVRSRRWVASRIEALDGQGS